MRCISVGTGVRSSGRPAANSDLRPRPFGIYCHSSLNPRLRDSLQITPLGTVLTGSAREHD